MIPLILLAVFTAPRVYQDIHRIFGHTHTHTHAHIHCACLCETDEISFHTHESQCPLCHFGFFSVKGPEPVQTIPSAVFRAVIIPVILISTELPAFTGPFSGRGPPKTR